MKTSASVRIEGILRKHRVELTFGAEPTCVPFEPDGAEWTVAADGPTKAGYARRLSAALRAGVLRGGLELFAPGKLYPGEINPRWALNVIARKDGRAMVPPRGGGSPATARTVAAFFSALAPALGLRVRPARLSDTVRGGAAWVLPLDWSREAGWSSPRWDWPHAVALLPAPGPAGLRLPLHMLPDGPPKRALTLELRAGRLEIFLPPLLQEPWSLLLAAVESALPPGVSCDYSGYVPADEAGCWKTLVLAADPGVLEINLPPCPTWKEYDRWLRALEKAQKEAGLRSWKQRPGEWPEGTGGGHHLLWGGPSVERNPFFTRPAWLVSVLRFWQHHPSLAYFFTGCYVGPSSQAPRPDESAKSLWDLEMAYSWLETLAAGEDHRTALADTLTHLHSDTSGNTHRSEVSFDKFWNTRFPGGSRGLIEFRALESLPRASWASAVALLWRALAAHLLEHPFREPLRDFQGLLHDRYFLPGELWADLLSVLSILRRGGVDLPRQPYAEIRDWRFPILLQRPGLTVRRGLEGWPLLCETPLEGGTTSRFVDTSMDRLELTATNSFARRFRISVNGRPLPWRPSDTGGALAGLRYRRTALHPSLHPGLPPQLPLILEIREADARQPAEAWELTAGALAFRRRPAGAPGPVRGAPCRLPSPQHWCHDLRLP